jgi:hypothetical protein
MTEGAHTAFPLWSEDDAASPAQGAAVSPKSVAPSLGLQFVRRRWNHKSRPPEGFHLAARAAQQSRRSITAKFAQLQQAFIAIAHSAKLIMGEKTEVGCAQYSLENTAAVLKQVADDERFSTVLRGNLQDLLVRYGAYQHRISIIVHGFVDVLETSSCEPCLRFESWGHRQTLTAKELNTEAERFGSFVEDALTRLRIIEEDLRLA